MPQPTLTRTLVVTDPIGVHIRTATALAKIVGQSQSEVTVVKGDQRAAATDIWSVLGLDTPQGQTLTLEAAGPDAAEILDQLEPLFAGRFGNEGT